MFTNYLPNSSYKKELSVILSFVLLLCSVSFAVSQVNGNGIIKSQKLVSSPTSLKKVAAAIDKQNYQHTSHLENLVNKDKSSLESYFNAVPPEVYLPLAKMEFVYIAPGTFEMGSKDGGHVGELKLHKVTLTRGFEMGRYEVTQGEWESIMGSNPSYLKRCGKNCPVENVTWEEVQEFISKLNEIKDGYIYRLPTEAEWEYACRAGLSGDFEGDLEEMGWFITNSGGTTHEVGKKKANDWGLSDMYGNVFEYVSDWFFFDFLDGVKDPTGPETGRDKVIRGGSWGFDKKQIQPSFRSSQWEPRDTNTGFRLVRTPLQ